MENFALLRRNNTNEEFEYLEYVNRVKMQIQRERERYLMSMDLNSNVYDDLSCFFDGGFGVGGHYGNYSDDGASSSGGGSSIDYNYNRVIGFCEVCYNHAIKGETTPFHCCKNDAVTQIFRSPAGPIGPPKKNSILG
ncbi:Latrophilin Cirl [Bienertia sinuspersici]